jgi:predicted dienelactone hydrolase
MKFWLGWHGNNLLKSLRGEIATSSLKTANKTPSSSLSNNAIGIGTFLLSLCFTSSVLAAERVTVRAGFLQQSVEVNALEDFVETGKVPPALKSYEFLLTPHLRQQLSRSLHVDPILVKPFLADLFGSPDGEKLLAQLSAALPGSSSQAIEETFSQTLTKKSTLSFLSFLRAYPSENLIFDLPSVARIAVQLNATYWQNQLIGPQLERDLQVKVDKATTFRFDPTVRGQHLVSTATFLLRDRTRQRDIPVDIYYSTKTRGPLVVISHGFAADRKFLKYLAHHLASHGFTVAALDHPGSNIAALFQTAVSMKLSKLLPASEFIDRPLDVTFLLDKLEQLNQSQGILSNKINTKQVTVIGHSYGSYTALALAGAELNPRALREFCQALTPLERSPADWLQCAAAELPYGKRQFRDPRVAQVIALNPIIGDLFGNNLSGVRVPTLILSSSDDGVTPTISHQLQPFKQLRGEKYLLIAFGGTHMSVTDMSNLDSTVGQSTLVREVMGIEANPIRELVKGTSLAFVEQLTPQAQSYRSFLSPAYVQSFSNDLLSFRLAKELPSSLDTWLNIVYLGSWRDSEDKPSVVKKIQGYFVNAKQILSQPGYCAGQLDYLFTGLLNTYDYDSQYWDNLS